MKAIVLGCGPAGLFATHALVQDGWDVKVYSKKRRSELYGAQYLHQPIPGLKQVEGKVRYILQGGTTTEYRRKVYGAHEVTVSPEMIDPVQIHPMWDIRASYYDAWSRYEEIIVNKSLLTGVHVDEIEQKEHPDLIVSSIPRYFLCRNPMHKFKSVTVWAVGDAPERGVFTRSIVRNLPLIPDEYVVCSADPNDSWYRLSNVFGYRTIEWPLRESVPVEAAKVKKPISNDCNCLSDLPLLHVGRYGRWEKGVLSHSAYFDTRARVMGDSIA